MLRIIVCAISMTEEQTQLKLSFKQDNLIRTNSIVSLSSSGISESEATFLPDVAFVPGSNNGGTIDSPRSNRENQPLLGRMEGDHILYNNFPGNSILLGLFQH